MFERDNINNDDEQYWQGNGRKLLIVPSEVIKWFILKNELLKPFYITGLGFYPADDLYYSVTAESHADMIIIICISGRGSCETSEGTFSVLPGQFFIVSAQEWHRYRADKDDPWSIYWISISGSHVPEFCAIPSVTKCFKPAEVNDLWKVTQILNGIYQTLDVGYCINRLQYCSLTLNHVLALLCNTTAVIKTKLPPAERN